jgi:hypothetical protein
MNIWTWIAAFLWIWLGAFTAGVLAMLYLMVWAIIG